MHPTGRLSGVANNPGRRQLDHGRSLQPPLLRLLSVLAVLGSIGLIGGNIWGSIVVPDHDWVADTVSDLAAGRYEIIQDVALYAYAVALFAMALAAAHAHAGGWGWSVGILSLAILGAVVTVIGARNEYGDGDDAGVVVHIYLVYALGFFFTLAPVAMAGGLAERSRKMKIAAYALAAVWAIGAAIYFMLPTDIDGAWERGLGIITVLFVALLAAHFAQLARAIDDQAVNNG